MNICVDAKVYWNCKSKSLPSLWSKAYKFNLFPLSLTIQLIRGSSPACQEGHIPFVLAHPVSSLVGKSGPLSRFDVLMVRWLALQLVIASEQASLGPVCHAMITGGLIRGNTSCHEEHIELDAKLTNQRGSKDAEKNRDRRQCRGDKAMQMRNKDPWNSLSDMSTCHKSNQHPMHRTKSQH